MTAQQLTDIADRTNEGRYQDVLGLMNAAAWGGAYRMQLDMPDLDLIPFLRHKGFRIEYMGSSCFVLWGHRPER